MGQDRIMGSKHGHIPLNKNVIMKNAPLLFFNKCTLKSLKNGHEGLGKFQTVQSTTAI